MLKKNKKMIIAANIITLLPILAGLLLWNRLPDQMAIHWGADGAANGWSSKPVAVFGLPVLMFIVEWICIWATLSDPRKKNISEKIFRAMVWGLSILSVILNGSCYFIAMGEVVNMNILVFLSLGVFFTIIGNYMPKTKQSYTMGIRLPWTLDSEENWNRTHRLTGFIWSICGLCMIVNAFMQWKWLSLTIIVTMILVPCVYSFILYKKGI